MKQGTELFVRALALASALTLAACGGGSGDTADVKPFGTGSTTSGTTGGTGTTTAAALASLQLSASPATVKSDNSGPTTVTVSALSASNAAIPNTVVTL